CASCGSKKCHPGICSNCGIPSATVRRHWRRQRALHDGRRALATGVRPRVPPLKLDVFMRYHALACDYDGTIAWDGRVDERTIEALIDVKKSGRKLILVTGRELDDLLKTFPRVDLFDRVVVENGGLLYRPATREERKLAERPPEDFVHELI